MARTTAQQSACFRHIRPERDWLAMGPRSVQGGRSALASRPSIALGPRRGNESAQQLRLLEQLPDECSIELGAVDFARLTK